MLFLSNSTFLFSQPQNIITPLSEGVTSERDFSYYNRLYSEFNLNQSVDSNLTLLSHLGIGPCYDAVPRDNYLFLGNGALFQILDISDPSNPVLVGEVLTEVGEITDIELYGDYAFFVYPFTVVDISDLSNPVIINTQNYGLFRIFIYDHYAFVDIFGGIKLIDIQNPFVPQIVSTIFISGEFVLGIAVKEDYLYVSNVYSIDIFNISDLINPLYIRSYGGIWGFLYVNDNYLYNGRHGFFEIYDISNPTNLIHFNGILTSKLAVDMFVDDTLVYLCHGYYGDGMSIIDVSDYSDLTILKYIDAKNSVIGYVKCNVKNNLAFISSAIGCDIYDVDFQSTDTLNYISTYLTSYSTDKIKLYNELLYCTNYAGGFKIIDYSDPYSLKTIGEYQEISKIKDFEISDNYAYLLTNSSIDILNIENPYQPYKINEIIFQDTLQDVASASVLVKDSILIASLPSDYLTFINIKDPFNPTVINIIPAGNRIHDLAIYKNYLFSSEGFDGLKIYKLDSLITEVNTIDSVSFALLIEDDFLYIYFEGGLSIYDLTNPESPAFIGRALLPGGGNVRMEISKLNDYIYLASNQNLEVVDVSDVNNPFIAAYSREGDYSAVASVKNIIFAGNDRRGIKVFRNDLITSVYFDSKETVISNIQLFQNFPNPFNSTTNIKYFLSERDYIKIKLYDVLGKEVEILDEGWKEAGYHQIELNTNNYASGVYLYTLTNNEKFISRKMILLK